MTYDFLTVYIPQDSASSKTVKTYRDGLTIFRRYVAEVKGFSIRSFSFSQCTFECCHVQYRRNRKSQQSECVPVSLHSTTLYAGLQKWARRYRKAVTVEQLYKGTLLQIDWCWKSNTRTPWTTAYLRRRIPRGQWAIRWIIHRLRWLFAQFLEYRWFCHRRKVLLPRCFAFHIRYIYNSHSTDYNKECPFACKGAEPYPFASGRYDRKMNLKEWKKEQWM